MGRTRALLWKSVTGLRCSWKEGAPEMRPHIQPPTRDRAKGRGACGLSCADRKCICAAPSTDRARRRQLWPGWSPAKCAMPGCGRLFPRSRPGLGWERRGGRAGRNSWRGAGGLILIGEKNGISWEPNLRTGWSGYENRNSNLSHLRA